MSNEVLAVVAGKEITNAELDAFLQNAPREQQAYVTNPQFRQQYLEQRISLPLFAPHLSAQIRAEKLTVRPTPF